MNHSFSPMCKISILLEFFKPVITFYHFLTIYSLSTYKHLPLILFLHIPSPNYNKVRWWARHQKKSVVNYQLSRKLWTRICQFWYTVRVQNNGTLFIAAIAVNLLCVKTTHSMCSCCYSPTKRNLTVDQLKHNIIGVQGSIK